MLQFEKYQQFAGGTLSGANYDALGIGEFLAATANAILGASTNALNKQLVEATNQTNLQIAQETNEANLQIAQDTNAANLQIARETNEAQKAESEKAYQRSTASNQIAELVRAGFSPQQAKLIVGGSGSAAAYPPASLTAAQMQAATMLPATMQAPQFDASTIGSGISQFASGLNSLASDLTAPDGGFLGYTQANSALEDISGHEDSFPDDFWSSPETMRSTINNKEWRSVNPWFDSKVEKHFNRALKSLQGRRSLMNFGRQMYDTYSVKNQVNLGKIEVQKGTIDLWIKRSTAAFEVSRARSEVDSIEINNQLAKWNLKTTEAEFVAKAEEFMLRAEQAKLELQQIKDPAYKAQWLKTHFSDLRCKEAIAEAAIVQSQIDKLDAETRKGLQEKFGSFISTWNVFKSMGLTQTDAGVVASSVLATGYFGLDAIDKQRESHGKKSLEDTLFDAIFGLNQSTEDKLKKHGDGRKF